MRTRALAQRGQATTGPLARRRRRRAREFPAALPYRRAHGAHRVQHTAARLVTARLLLGPLGHLSPLDDRADETALRADVPEEVARRLRQRAAQATHSFTCDDAACRSLGWQIG